jgi:hypothetical protein
MIEYRARLVPGKGSRFYRVLCGRPTCSGNLGVAVNDPTRWRLAIEGWVSGFRSGKDHVPFAAVSDASAVIVGPPDSQRAMPDGEWLVDHRWGFRWDAQGEVYRVLPPAEGEGQSKKRRRSPRPMPRSLLTDETGRPTADAWGEIVGLLPPLSATHITRIACPLCRTPNRVDPPA